jgi:orotate phosphoribosyltransferase
MSDELRELSKELARAALAIGAIKLRPEDPFTWASGYCMPIYNDNRLLLGSADHRALVAKGFCALIERQMDGFKPEAVAGVVTAGVPHATTLADRLELPLVYVRERPKDHGVKKRIEGVLDRGARVLLIEDLISFGGSSVSALEALREAGARCDVCFSIFSYGFGESARAFETVSARYFSLLRFAELLDVAKQEGLIDAESQRALEEWQADPLNWGEKRGLSRVVRD